jgi:hypothetical protein
VLFNTAISGHNAGYILYTPSNNTIYLRNDNHSEWMAGVIGSSTILQNSQVWIDCSEASATNLSSTNKRLRIEIYFKLAFQGQKNIYQLAIDASGARSDWEKTGEYLVY